MKKLSLMMAVIIVFNLCFLGCASSEMESETIPEVTRETVPETTVEIVTETTEAVTEATEETFPEVEDDTSVPEEETSEDSEEINIEIPAPQELTLKAVWQDPENAVLLWEGREGCEYTVLRSEEIDGEYLNIGTSVNNSYRDDTAEYPNSYYYKIEEYYQQQFLSESEPVQPIVDPSEIASVSVIMYHNFVTVEDIGNGIVYDEYAISPAAFEEDLIWLRDNGYITITSAELMHYLESKEPIPQKAVILSIDDGSWGVYNHAWPLLKKYNMKADFNVIGAQIDETWDMLHAGGTREGLAAPYCTWEELIEMMKSGEINLCSHTYGLHVYNRNNRIGMSMMNNETKEQFAAVVKEDYDLMVSCIEGWTGKMPETVALPYSKHSTEGDKIILETTGYKMIMGGQYARGTSGNYFVEGCDYSNQLMIMSRSCRMDGTPIQVYLNKMIIEGIQNGVNLQNP